MASLFESLQEFLTREAIGFRVVPEPPAAHVVIDGKSGQWVALLAAREDEAQLLIYSVCPLKAPARRRPQVADFITRANWGMVLGNFELDFEDGEVRFKTSSDLSGVAAADRPAAAATQAAALFFANLNMMDTYLPGLAAVIAGDVDPASAIADIDLAQLGA